MSSWSIMVVLVLSALSARAEQAVRGRPASRGSRAAFEVPGAAVFDIQSPAFPLKIDAPPPGHAETLALASLARQEGAAGERAREALAYLADPKAAPSLEGRPAYLLSLLRIQENQRWRSARGVVANLSGYLSGAGSRDPAIAALLEEGKRQGPRGSDEERAERFIAALPELFDGMARGSVQEAQRFKDSQDAVLALFTLAHQTLLSRWDKPNPVDHSVKAVDRAIEDRHFHIRSARGSEAGGDALYVAVPEAVAHALPAIKTLLASLGRVCGQDRFLFHKALTQLTSEVVQAAGRSASLEQLEGNLADVLGSYDEQKLAEQVVFAGGVHAAPETLPALPIPQARPDAGQASLWGRLSGAFRRLVTRLRGGLPAAPPTGQLPQAALPMDTELIGQIGQYFEEIRRHAPEMASLLGSRYAPPQRIRDLLNRWERKLLTQPPVQAGSFQHLGLSPYHLSYTNPYGNHIFVISQDEGYRHNSTILWFYSRLATLLDSVNAKRPEALSLGDFGSFFSYVLELQRDSGYLSNDDKVQLRPVLKELVRNAERMLARKALSARSALALDALSVVADFDDAKRQWQTKIGYDAPFSEIAGLLKPEILRLSPEELQGITLGEAMPPGLTEISKALGDYVHDLIFQKGEYAVTLGNGWIPPRRIRDLIDQMEELLLAQAKPDAPLWDRIEWLGRIVYLWQPPLITDSRYEPEPSKDDPSMQYGPLIWIYTRIAQLLELIESRRPEFISLSDSERFFSIVKDFHDHRASDQSYKMYKQARTMMLRKALADKTRPLLELFETFAEFDAVEGCWAAKPLYQDAWGLLLERLEPVVARKSPRELKGHPVGEALRAL